MNRELKRDSLILVPLFESGKKRMLIADGRPRETSPSIPWSVSGAGKWGISPKYTGYNFPKFTSYNFASSLEIMASIWYAIQCATLWSQILMMTSEVFPLRAGTHIKEREIVSKACLIWRLGLKVSIVFDWTEHT